MAGAERMTVEDVVRLASWSSAWGLRVSKSEVSRIAACWTTSKAPCLRPPALGMDEQGTPPHGRSLLVRR